jgi:hypothetical protein
MHQLRAAHVRLSLRNLSAIAALPRTSALCQQETRAPQQRNRAVSWFKRVICSFVGCFAEFIGT